MFEFIPNIDKGLYSTTLRKVGDKTTVGEVLDNEILEKFPNLKDIPIKVVEDLRNKKGKPVRGLFINRGGRKEIRVKEGFNLDEDQVLTHEIQHALEDEMGFDVKNRSESLPDTNDFVMDTERMMKTGNSREDIERDFDEKIENLEKLRGTKKLKDILETQNQLKNAKLIFQRFLDEGKRDIA